MTHRTLGLDIGTNSVGWAVIEVPDSEDETGRVIAMGSRVFPEGAEVAGNALKTKGASRRQARTLRRQVRRRAARKQVLRRELSRIGLLPDDDAEFDALMASDPVELMDRSDHGDALTLREIGRIVYWFSSRRGFLSLRTGGSTVIDDDAADGPDRYRLSQFSAVTGEQLVIGQEDRLMGILQQQATHHPAILTDNVLYGRRGRMTYPVRPVPRTDFLAGPDATLLDEFGLHGLVFLQRAVFWHESTIGACSLNPTRGQPRAARAERIAQEFRVRKLAMDLRVEEDMRPLTDDERRRVIDKLSHQKSLSFGALRKLLGFHPTTPINFDDGEKTSLTGNETDVTMKSLLGDTWSHLSDSDQDDIVHVVLGGGTIDEQRIQLCSRFGLSDDQADAVLAARFPTGRSKYSRQTLRRLLPHLDHAANERDAILAAGFPSPEEARRERTVVIDDITNPMVRAALVQVRKVVEAVAAEYGHRDSDTPFDVIRIELARDVRATASDRANINKQQRSRERERAQIVEQIEEFTPGAGNSRDAQRRVRLWKEQQERCLYTGTVLTLQAALDGSRTQIDHILPRSRTLNNSDANVALVLASANQDKGDRTIHEWAGDSKVAEIADRARQFGLRRAKIRNIERVDVPNDTIPESLLITTGYINAVARDLVTQITGCPVEVSRGRLTGELRYMTGLIKDHDDHRRHALDAAMVAITTPAIANRLARRYKTRQRTDVDTDDKGSFEPWPGARQHILDVYDTIVTSHKPMRKVSGQFVEDTHYGRVAADDGTTLWARRRDLTSGLTRKQLDEVADPIVKACLVNNLLARGLDPAASQLKFDPDDLPTMPDGTPIRTVRCHMSLPSNVVMRADQPNTSQTPAGNQSAAVIKNTKGRHRIVVLSRFAAQQHRALSPRAWFSDELADGDELCFTIAIGETICLTRNNHNEYFTITGLDGASNRLLSRGTNDSSSNPQRLSAKTLSDAAAAKKVVITPAGLIRDARD